MGFSKKLFLDADHTSFICSKCDDVAIDPVPKPCCGGILCQQCSCSGYDCDHGNGGESMPVFKLNQGQRYMSLRMKCYKCAKAVTIGTLGSHYEVCIKEKLEKLEESFENLSELNQFLKEKCKKLEQDNVQLWNANNERSLAIVSDSSQSKVSDGYKRGRQNIIRTTDLGGSDGGRKLPRVLQPESRPKFILDAGESKSVPYGMIENLERLILEQCSDGIKLPLKHFFDPIRLAMNREFKGNWQNYDASLFDPNRAKCKRDREIHYSIQWNVPSLGTTKHVTFDLNSNASTNGK